MCMLNQYLWNMAIMAIHDDTVYADSDGFSDLSNIKDPAA